MKISTLFLIALLALSGCTTTYKGEIKGASDQEESKSAKDIVGDSNKNQVKP